MRILPFVFYKLFSKVASIMIVAYGGCLHHLAAGSPRPGFCTDMKGGINEIYVRGGTGADPPLVYLAVTTCLGDVDQ